MTDSVARSQLLAETAEPARLRAFWDARYREFTLSESGWSGAGERLNDRLYACKRQALLRSLRAAGVTASTRFSVLDAGCGQGFFAQLYARSFRSATYVGVDISERAIAHLRASTPATEFHHGDIARWIDPAARRFDVVQAFEVLHLILDDGVFVEALRHLARHTADDGVLLLTAALPERTVQPAGYLRYRSRGQWLDVLGPLGLRIVDERRMYYWLPAGGPANRYLRFAMTGLGPAALYAADRAALALGVPQPPSSGPDCRMHLLTIRRAS